MVSLLPSKFHEILFGSFRGVALTNCVTDRRTGQKQYVSPPKWGRHNNSSSHIKVSKLKGMSWIQLFKYIKFIHILGFVGSIVKGETICGGSTEPTLPKSASLSIIVLLMKFTKRLQLLALLSTLAGGNFVSYCTPQKVHIKGLIYLLMLTPFSSQFIISLNFVWGITQN
jgi:hypothetical protein